jgi:ABC-type cobalamin/Fe3+-siderophores transport system ATPase subunit
MRQAQAEDAWRRSTTADRGFRLHRIRAIEKAPFTDLEEQLENGLTIVCGLNGVGKTTILRLIEATLAGAENVERVARDEIFSAGEFYVSVEVDSQESEIALDQADAERPPVLLLDAFTLCGRLLRVVEQPNFADLLEGVEAREFGPDELKTASYVVGRRYEALRVFEVEETGVEEERVVPVFEATVGGTTYGFSAMGLGELAALAALWYVDRVEAGTVLLVEEPETFLSAHSTVAFMDVLAEKIHARRLYAVITTHSMEIIARAPLSVVRVLTVADGAVTVRRPATRAELEYLLRAYLGQARVLLVEDRAARVFVTEILGRYAGLWGQAVKVLATNGAEGVQSICRQLPQTDVLRVVGLLDGDQADPDPADFLWPIFRLPGHDSPEQLLYEAAIGNRELFANRVGRPTEALDPAFEAAAGNDVHDWFQNVAQSLMLDPVAVLRAATSCWLAVGPNEADARALVERITAALVD